MIFQSTKALHCLDPMKVLYSNIKTRTRNMMTKTPLALDHTKKRCVLLLFLSPFLQ